MGRTLAGTEFELIHKKPGSLATSGFGVGDSLGNQTVAGLALATTAIATALFDDLLHDVVRDGIEVAWLHAVAGAA